MKPALSPQLWNGPTAAYLTLDRVLGAQHPVTDAHDELLFIVQHQTSELWMKLAIHEIRAARNAIRTADELQPAFKMLTRVARIFEQLNAAWDVLRTMTPSEYTQAFAKGLAAPPGFNPINIARSSFCSAIVSPAC